MRQFIQILYHFSSEVNLLKVRLYESTLQELTGADAAAQALCEKIRSTLHKERIKYKIK